MSILKTFNTGLAQVDTDWAQSLGSLLLPSGHGRLVSFHTVVLLHAIRLGAYESHLLEEFCIAMGVPGSYAIEMRKMLRLHEILKLSEDKRAEMHQTLRARKHMEEFGDE